MKLPRVPPFLIWAVFFGLAYAQAPLYYSNQNQYFLHGLATVDDGPLRDDWLANTASPTPAFDALVAITARAGCEFAFHGYYALLLGVYFSSLVGLFDFLAGERATPGRRLAFSALLLPVHSAALRWASYRLLDADYPCYLQGWLAAQYVLGPVFQPSAFGVFLIAGIHQFLRDRPLLAATCLGAACIGHATYLLPASMLTLTFAILLVRDGRRGRALAVMGLAFVLVLPVLIHAYANFRPTSPEVFAEASRILAHERIPHHCQPRRWFDAIAGLQIVFLIVAWFLLRRTRLSPIFGVLFGASAALTLVQIVTDSDALALLFPWRSSVALLPLATAIVLTQGVLLAGRWIDSAAARWTSRIGIASLACAGLLLMLLRQGFAVNDAEDPLMRRVRETRRPGDVYMIPVTVPKLSEGRGAISSDFKPLPSQRGDGRVIPVDFQRFRLGAGVPVYADFKAIPYRDVDVLEWRRRVEWNAEVTRTGRVTREELLGRGITRVVVPRDRPMPGEGLEFLWEEGDYRVYGVQ